MKTFEEAVRELKEIIQKLESGNLPLEDSIKLFQEGTELISLSHKKLNEIRKKVEILVQRTVISSLRNSNRKTDTKWDSI